MRIAAKGGEQPNAEVNEEVLNLRLFGLGIERIDVTDAADHVQIDHAVGPRSAWCVGRRFARQQRAGPGRDSDAEERFRDQPVERPPHWGMYLVEPVRVQLWRAAPHRLHDCFSYRRAGATWSVERVAP